MARGSGGRGAPAGGAADGLDEAFAGFALGDKTDRPGLFGGLPGAGVVMHGEDDDASVGVAVAEDRRRFNALVGARHADIEDDDVGLEGAGEGDGGIAVPGFADDFDIGLDLELHAEAAPDRCFVVCDEDPHS